VQGAALPGAYLFGSQDLSDLDGPFQSVRFEWLRDGVPIAGADQDHYYIRFADIGTRLSWRLTAVGADGAVESFESTASDVVPGLSVFTGSAGNDRLTGGYGASAVYGLAGDDTLEGRDAFDSLVGGAGNDLLIASFGADTLDGGEGFDVVRAQDVDSVYYLVNFSFPAGQLVVSRSFDSVKTAEQVLSSIEGAIGTAGDDRFIGLNGPERVRGETFRPMLGNDTVDGGTGIDTVEVMGKREAYSLSRSGTQLILSSKSSPVQDVDTLTSIERIRFDDQLVCFGTRAEEVAKVAIALWSKLIIPSKDLFARGFSWYDAGYLFKDGGRTYADLVDIAITYFATDTDLQFAQRLSGNVASGRSASDVLALMQQHGGGNAGRAWATQFMADDPANTGSLEFIGLRNNGIEANLMADGVMLFGLIPG
jgi:hypothetical protein